MQVQSAYFFPVYPENGLPIFEGLFDAFCRALYDLCEFIASNVYECGVGKQQRMYSIRQKDIFRKWAQLPGQLRNFSLGLHLREIIQELGKSKRQAENKQANNSTKIKRNTIIQTFQRSKGGEIQVRDLGCVTQLQLEETSQAKKQQQRDKERVEYGDGQFIDFLYTSLNM